MKFIFLVLFFWVWQSLFCQYNLDFSRVKLFSVQGPVPANKVWKIESVIYNIPQTSSGVQTSNCSCAFGSYESTSIMVNGISTKVGNDTVPAAYSNVMNTHSYSSLPIWLPSASTLSDETCFNKISIL